MWLVDGYLYFEVRGRGCGAVGKAVASDTGDPQIESRHQQNFLNLICVNCL